MGGEEKAFLPDLWDLLAVYLIDVGWIGIGRGSGYHGYKVKKACSVLVMIKITLLFVIDGDDNDDSKGKKSRIDNGLMRMRRQLMTREITTYPIPLLEKQSPRLLQHLSIGFLLAHIGVKVGRVGMHLNTPPTSPFSQSALSHTLLPLFSPFFFAVYLSLNNYILSN